MIGARSNLGSALSRKANAALKGRIESVGVKSSGFARFAGGQVFNKGSAKEIEPLMAARQILTDAGIVCSPIKSDAAWGPSFYIKFNQGEAA
jgi:hypothetical protein